MLKLLTTFYLTEMLLKSLIHNSDWGISEAVMSSNDQAVPSCCSRLHVLSLGSGSSMLSGVLRIMSLLCLVLFQKSSLLMWYFLRLLEPGVNYE